MQQEEYEKEAGGFGNYFVTSADRVSFRTSNFHSLRRIFYFEDNTVFIAATNLLPPSFKCITQDETQQQEQTIFPIYRNIQLLSFMFPTLELRLRILFQTE
jgi:hypothetical protein